MRTWVLASLIHRSQCVITEEIQRNTLAAIIQAQSIAGFDESIARTLVGCERLR